jgi:hypothetical protein
MTKTCLAFVVLAGCVPTGTYVADVHYDSGGNLVMEKCQFDGRGRATGVCHTEDVQDSGWVRPPDPPTVAAAERAANAPVPKRPAPTAADVDRAIASPGVKRAVALCRTSYDPDLASFAFTLGLSPDGKISIAPHDAPEPFASCASRALRTANLIAYDGAPMSFEETLTF